MKVLGIAPKSSNAEFLRELDKAEVAIGLNKLVVPGLLAWQRRNNLFKALRACKETYDTVMIFCHGWPTSLSGFGITRKFIPAFVECLAHVGCKKVVLYACLTGSDTVTPKIGKPYKTVPWAYSLSVAAPDVEIICHTTSGHTTRNPYTQRYFDGNSTWVVSPRDPMWKAWNAELHKPKSPFRFLFPTMTETEINATLAPVSE